MNHITSSEDIYFCNFCPKSFNSKNGWQNHTDTKHGISSNIMCNCCVTQYESILKHMNEYKEHYATFINPSGTNSTPQATSNSQMGAKMNLIACTNCDKVFKQEIDLKQHLLAKHCIGTPNSPSSLVSYMNSAVKNSECIYCSKNFPTSDGLQRHQDAKHKDIDYFPCNYCSHHFKSVKGKIDHTKAVHCVTVMNCSHCPQLFKNQQNLDQHIKNIHTCHLCKIILKDQKAKELHLQTIHLRDLCPYCPKIFLKSDLKQHILSAHNLLPCTLCNNNFTQREGLQHHLKQFHQKMLCLHCSKMFDKLESMKQHVSSVHPNISFCEHCNKVFKKKADLDQHKEAIHSNFIQCVKCCKVFKKVVDLQQHMSTTHSAQSSIKSEVEKKNFGEDYFPCNICSRLFPSESTRRAHHEQAHTYSCGYCTKTFNEMIQLKQHKDGKHKNVDFFPCNFCSKEFTSNAGRNYHVEALHIFTCYICSKTFQEAIQLEQHKHTKHQPVKVLPPPQIFKCKYCTTTFNEANFLKQHEEIKHKNINYFPCEYCSEKFDSNISRRNHFINIHSNMTQYCLNPFSTKIKNKQYICMYCLRSFSSRDELKIHEIQLHKVVK